MPCTDSWEGVYCTSQRGLDSTVPQSAGCSVTGLVLPLMNLRGQLPASIANLTQIRILSLGFNFLIGTIPISLGNLVALMILDLSANVLTGRIPSTLGNLSELMELELTENSLTGQIPLSLCQLTALTKIAVNENLLTGPVLSSLGGLTLLTFLALDINSLTGTIPSSLGNLSMLTMLALDQNLLSGSIPSSLGNLTALSQLYLDLNALTGSIPPSLGNLSMLTILALNQNSLSGPIPSSLGGLSLLSILYLYVNALTGCIPSSLGGLSELTYLFLEENSLTGTIPSSLGRLMLLTQLGLNVNYLIGPIPPSLGGLTGLTLLYFDINALTGIIPTSLGRLRGLLGLYLEQNALSESIPSSLGGLTALTYLSLNVNVLTSSIPSSLGRLAALTFLYLDENMLTGLIPSSLDGLVALTGLYLFNNELSGPIPSSLGGLTALAELALEYNALTGPIPLSLGALVSLTYLALADNSLTGPVPSSLGNLAGLSQLDLSSNSFIGTVPTSFGLLKACYYFNASGNSLTGLIPPELGYLGSNLSLSDKLVRAGVSLDLSQTALSGTIPSGLFSKQLQTVLLYSNCLHGSLPTEICSSTNLQTLVLDKLTSGASCQRIVPGFKGTFAETTLQGSIPECVWTMPRLQTLHLAGNGLQGSLGDIGSTSSLLNINVSNNFLTGSIPTSLQTQKTLQQLALANNKLTGTLSPSFVLSNLTLLTLAVNRLSGDIPASFISPPSLMQTFSVLSGNLFTCGSPLPAADPASASYVCRSNDLDIGLYICGTSTLILFLLCLFASLNRIQSGRFQCLYMRQLSNQGLIWFKKHYSEAVLQLTNFRRLLNVIADLRVWLCVIGLFYAVICMPIYAILKTVASAGIITEQYTWVTASAFLHDYASASVIGMFVCISIAFWIAFIWRLNYLLNPLSTDHGSAKQRLVASGSSGVNWRFAFQRVGLQTFSLLIVCVVNVCYVYGLVFGQLSLSQQLVAQVALGIFKLLWQQLFVRYTISWMARNHADISEEGLLFHQLAMNDISLIVAPCLATLGTDSDCLYNALLGDPSISSSFNITLFSSYCYTSTSVNNFIHTNCIEFPYEQLTTISTKPPWFYSYQCTSALLTNYIPVLLIILATSGVLMPLLQLLTMGFPDDVKHRFLCLGFLREQGLPSPRKMTADVLIDVSVLMTFGLASPLLGLMIVLKQVSTTVIIRLSIGRYLQQAKDATSEEAAAFASLEDAAMKFRGGDATSLLVFLLCVVGVFWGAMIFDMVADLYGNIAGGVAWTLAFIVWVLIALILYLVKIESVSDLSAPILNGTENRDGHEIFASQPKDAANGDVWLTVTTNAIFDSERALSVDSRLEGHRLNSTFHCERKDELEMIPGNLETGKARSRQPEELL